MSDELLSTADGSGVALLTFNRPDSGNAWSFDLNEAYLAALRELEDDSAIRAVVVTGAGDSFCVGTVGGGVDAVSRGQQAPDPMRPRSSSTEPIRFAKPLIAAVNGPATGVGFAQSLMADVRIAAQSAVFAATHADHDFVSEHDVAWLLTQIAGRGVALDLLLSARRVDSQEAAQLGLVHRVVTDDTLLEASLAYARKLATSSSPASMSAIKHQITSQSMMTIAAAEEASRAMVDASLAGPDFAEGLTSYLERRPAAFAPLGAGTTFSFDSDATRADRAER